MHDAQSRTEEHKSINAQFTIYSMHDAKVTMHNQEQKNIRAKEHKFFVLRG